MIAFAIAAVLVQPQYLTEIPAREFEASGSVADLRERALVCAALELSPAEGSDVIATDTSSMIVARAAARYRRGLLDEEVRANVLIQLGDGTFSVAYRNIEGRSFTEVNSPLSGLLSPPGTWQQIGLWAGGGGRRAETELNAETDRLAACIQGA